MIIKSLHIKNFRQHKELKYNFHPGLNVITGPTGAGKSAILRSLRFAIRNKPQGESIFPKKKKNALVEVSVRVPGHEVCRMKSKSINSYLLNETELKSFKNNVPKQIKDVLNLEDFNFQLQYDRHFLLDDSPGEVAVKLNEVANLTIIDEYNTNVRSIIDKANSEVTTIENAIKNKKDEIEGYVSYQTEQQDIEDFLAQQSVIEVSEEDVAEVQSLLKSIYDINDQIEEEQEVIQYEDQIQQLISMETEIDYLEEEIKFIQKYVSEIKNIDNKIIDKNEIIGYEKEIICLMDLANELNISMSMVKDVEERVYQIKNIDEDFKMKKINMEMLEKQYEELKKEAKVCPVCSKPF